VKFISEAQSAALITHELAFEAVREALIAASSDSSHIFPAVIAHGSLPSNTFSIKSGATAELAGLKVGSYWPGNFSKGIPCHNSVILLFDQQMGRIEAIIEAAEVNAYRTAAADALAVDLLARKEARTLAIFGAGHQADYEFRAIARVRRIESVLVVARNKGRGEGFAERLCAKEVAASLVDARSACEAADIIVTATPSRAPLFDAAWVRPGTHISSMGSDAKGKQELPPALLEHADLFCDLPQQSIRIGEFQHIAHRVEANALSLTAIGDALSGKAPGRRSAGAITVFDSSGIALQDLYVGRMLLAQAFAREIQGSGQR
jgi:ornithine cyclodeaminase